MKSWPIFLGIVVSAILTRVFIFGVYSISSGSMENTLIPGDKVLVNKLSFGPALPRSPLDIPLINFLHMRTSTTLNKDSVWWNYKRLQGYQVNCRGNVMVFLHPIWSGRPEENIIGKASFVCFSNGLTSFNWKRLQKTKARFRYSFWTFEPLFESGFNLAINQFRLNFDYST